MLKEGHARLERLLNNDWYRVRRHALTPREAQDLHPDGNSNGRMICGRRETRWDSDDRESRQSCKNSIPPNLRRRTDLHSEVLLLWVEDGV